MRNRSLLLTVGILAAMLLFTSLPFAVRAAEIDEINAAIQASGAIIRNQNFLFRERRVEKGSWGVFRSIGIED